MVIHAFGLPLTAIYFDVDPPWKTIIEPTRKFLHSVFCNDGRLLIDALAFVCRVFFDFYCVSDVCRNLCITIICILISAQDFVTMLQPLKEIKTFKAFLKKFRTISVIFSETSHFESLIADLMFVGLGFGVVSNYVTITLRSHMPPAMYYAYPVISVAIFIIIYLSLPFGIQTTVQSMECIRLRMDDVASKGSVTSVQRKIWIKELRALKELRLGGGLFGYTLYKLKRSTAIAYYRTHLDYTITSLLSIKIK